MSPSAPALGRSAIIPALVLSSCALLALLVGAVLAGPAVGTAAAVLVLFVPLAPRVASIRGFALAAALLVCPPGVIGEQSFLTSLVGLGVALLAVISTPTEEVETAHDPVFRTLMFLIPQVVALGFQWATPGYLYMLPAYWFVGYIATLLCSRPSLITEAARVLGVAAAALATSYFVSIVTGFTQLQHTSIGEREFSIAFPMTPNTVGQTLLPYPRLALFTGEPGLNIFYLLFIIAGLWCSRGAWRIVAVVLGPVLVILSQSTGIFLASAVGLTAGLVFYALQHQKLLTLLVVILTAGLSAPPLFNAAIAAKASDNPASLQDRGLGVEGVASSAAAGDVNLLRLLTTQPAAFALISLALLLCIALAVSSSLGTAATTVFVVTAALLQPTQWFFGAWLMLLAILIACQNNHPAYPRRAWQFVSTVPRSTERQGLPS